MRFRCKFENGYSFYAFTGLHLLSTLKKKKNDRKRPNLKKGKSPGNEVAHFSGYLQLSAHSILSAFYDIVGSITSHFPGNEPALTRVSGGNRA